MGVFCYNKTMQNIKCQFCEVVAKEREEVARNDLAWAFPTNIPIVPGHVLICPIRCVATFDELTPEEILAVFDLRNKLKKAMTKVFAAEGFNQAWNEGKIAGQAVPHFHLHMLPRKKGDTGITVHDPRLFLYRPGECSEVSEEELQKISQTIKKGL